MTRHCSPAVVASLFGVARGLTGVAGALAPAGVVLAGWGVGLEVCCAWGAWCAGLPCMKCQPTHSARITASAIPTNHPAPPRPSPSAVSSLEASVYAAMPLRDAVVSTCLGSGGGGGGGGGAAARGGAI